VDQPAQREARRAAARPMLRESVYESVKRLLMDDDLEPGSRVCIDALSRDLRVSPTPIREALFRCEAEGLVVRRPNAGYTVAPPLDRAGLTDLYDLRLLLEPPAAARAARRAGPADLAAIRAAVAAMSPDVTGDGYRSYRDLAAQDAALHAAIATAAGNPLIADTLRRLRAHTHTYRRLFHHGVAAETVAEHAAVATAITAGNPTAADTAMQTHLTAARDRLLATLS
jgi:DNA-binding GntR family transcriptional regulator